MKNYYTTLRCFFYAITGVCLFALFSYNAHGQCTSTGAFGSGAAPAAGSTTSLTTCAYAGEYSTISSVVAATQYISSGTGGTGNYITIRQGTYNGTAIAWGLSPLTWTSTVAGTYFQHVHTSAGCGTESACHTLTIFRPTGGGGGGGCTNTTMYPSTSFAAPAGGTTYTINTCNFASEYNQMTGAVAGNTFVSTASTAGTYITVRAGTYNGTVVANGTTPLSWTAAAGGTYFIHYNTNSSCGTASSCMTTTIQNTSVVAGPCSSITTISACGSSIISTHNGSGSYNPPSTSCGFTTPGQEKVYQFTPTSTGLHQLNVTSATGGYIDYFIKAASDGCSSTGWTCIDDISSAGSVSLGTLTSGVTYYILLDPEGTGSYSHTFNIGCPVVAYNPCSPLAGTLTCGTNASTSMSGSGAPWNLTTCDAFATTIGQERVFSFTPSVTGNHNITVSSLSGGWVDFYYKAQSAGCSNSGWTCAGLTLSAPYTGTAINLTAGVPYYILLDAEQTASTNITFQIPCIAPATPAYRASFISMSTGSSNWCAGETRTVSVTVQNTGTATWTNSGPEVNIGVKWNAEADYNVRVDADNLASGNTATYNLTITAPLTTGANNLTFDVVNEGSCWFGTNGGSCGPGNSVYVSPAITINAVPSAPTSVTASPATLCPPGGASQLNATSAGNTIRWYTVASAGSNIGTSTSGVNFQVNPGSTTTYYAEAYTAAGCASATRTAVTVTVGDSTPPTINCPSPITTGTPSGMCGAIVNFIPPTGSDNCPGASTSQIGGLTSGSTFPVGTTTNTFLVTANNGQTAQCSFTVIVNDTQAPSAICQNVTVTLGVGGTASVSASQVNNGSVDNCGITGTSLSGNTSYTCNDAGGTFTVTLQVNDAVGNTATCSANVQVQEVIPPSVSCKSYSVNLSGSSATVTQADVYDTGNDNCGTIILSSVSPTTFTCNDLGANTVVLTVSDGNGNTGTCSSTVMVSDVTPPTFTYCPENIVVNADGGCIALVTWTEPVATDNCGFDVEQTAGSESGQYFSLGSSTITYVVTDASSLTASCSFTVTVQDVTPPILGCLPDNVAVSLSGTSVTITPEDVIWYGIDNCGYLYYNDVVPNTFDCSHIGTGQTVVLTVNDGNGNSSTCSATVMVSDEAAPTAACQDISVDLDASGNISISAEDINNDSSDNCGLAGMSIDVSDFDCDDVGSTITVTLTVLDVNGNPSECASTVTVNDVTAPEAQCKSISVNLGNDNSVTISGSDIDDGSSDACGIASLTASPDTFDCDNVGENTVTLTVYDNNGNSSECTATVTVVDPEAPVAECQNISVTLDENGMVSISTEDIDNGSSDNCDFDLSLDPTDFTCANQGTNTVTLTATDGSGNTSTCSATVTVGLSYSTSISASGSTTLCEGESVDLDAGDYAAYQWSANASNSTGQTVTVTESGTYSVTVTDGNGCTSSAEISVVVNSLPTPEITADGATSFCDGESVGLDAGDYSVYQWNDLGDDATTQTITATEAGIYSVTVTDANGCTGEASIEITVYDLPEITVTGTTQVCEGGALDFTASGGTGYEWSGPNDFTSNSDNVTFTDAQASLSGTYTVTVTNENGCTAEYAVIVAVNAAPDAQITGNTIVCQNDALSLTATGGTTYMWEGPNGYSSTGDNLVRSDFDDTMVGTYSVTVSDNIGCSAVASVTVSISGSGFSVSVSGNTNTCIGGNISLSASAMGAVSYSWTGPDGFVNNSASFTILNATLDMSGTYTVYATSANGCIATTTREVTVNATTASVTGTTNVCVGGSINLIASGGNSYVWSGPGGYSSTAHSILRNNANTTMSGVYSVTVSNSTGCTGTANIMVTVHPKPSATLSGTSSICSGGTITITAPAGATSYVWSGPNSFTATGGPSLVRPNANSTMAGQYKVTVTNAGGCTASASRSITVSAPTTANVTGATSVCSNANVLLTATTAGVAYSWTGPGGFAATTAAISAPPVAGAYLVTVTASAGCISTATRNVTIVAAPNAVITGNLNVCVGGTISLLATGGSTYNWSGPGGYTRVGNSVLRTAATVAMSGTYTVTVTGSGGCKSTASVYVTVSACKNGEDEIAFETLFAYPNPTNDLTTITFTALKAEQMYLSVFAVDGKEVAVLFNGMTESETPYEFVLNTNDLPSGTYYAMLKRAGGATQQLKLMVIR